MTDQRVKKKLKPSLPDLDVGEKWDSFHDDPTCDVTIKSRDGVCFRASSYRLGKIR